MPSFLNKISENKLAWYITGAGSIIALWVMVIQHGWINNDSVLYFEMARLFSNHEWQKGMALFKWPLYPLLISVLHSAMGLSLHFSAQLLNLVFFAITCYSFIALIRLCGGSKTTMLAGAGLLFSATYITGDILPMLMRDQGFWAFSLAGYVFFIRYYQKRQLKDALLWQTCIILAMLFRVEGFSLLIGLPIILLFDNRFLIKQKLRNFLIANLFFIVSGLFIFLALTLFRVITISDLGRFQEITHHFNQMLNHLMTKSNQLGNNILGKYLTDYSALAFSVGLFTIVIAKAINITGLLASLLVILNLKSLKKLMLPEPSKILIWALCINFINMIFILLSVYALSGRYIIGFSLIFLVFASFGLHHFLESTLPRQSFSVKTKLVFKYLIMGMMVLSFVKIIWPKSQGYNYEQEAVQWIKQHNTNNSPVFYVSPRARYYAGASYEARGYDYWNYTQNAIQSEIYLQYDYLVINLEKDHMAEEQALINSISGYKKVAEFLGYKSKKKMLILKKST